MSDSALSSRQLHALLDVSRAFVAATDVDGLLERIAAACTAMLECERASVFVHDPRCNELYTRVALQSVEIRLPASSGIAGHVFTTNQLLHVSRPYADPRFNPEPDRASGFVTRNLLTVPMVDIHRKPVGVLQAINSTDDDFSECDKQMIQLLADQAGVAIQRHQLQQQAIEAVSLRREMELAAAVQDAIIPDFPPNIPGIESIGYAKPASITGGDCFDLWKMNDGRLGIFLGDATGHGVAPALMISQVRTVIRSLCEIYRDPFELMGHVNARFAEDFESGKFATAFYGILSSDGALEWCSAGHGPLIFRTDPSQPPQIREANGVPLGIERRQFVADRADPLQLLPGGVVAVVSDGIFESYNPAMQQFGIERVASILDKQSGKPLEQVLQQVRQSLLEWQTQPDPHDDQTMVIVRKR